MKSDEIRFLSLVASMTHLTPSEIMSLSEFPFTQEKAESYLQKWHNKGWYFYSSTLGDGKLTSEGIKQARRVGVLTK
ncbi:hypothetical protein JI721_16785 [Alicyclobacillus cycloheptanicus]|uniref:Uncharacterized protein n=1 Tax=Alicyclobacillus cycloheptanicus TaxID=1457 RepID=A0ABT9XGE8_9BACL|nr:hypothetical protein [Alicyclobacillus cycloheptanicus]MDQ0189367.1 hypothetical protein [Alicyclobacillus cycloheptanicus]WDM01280.1 hypothetical protein JI721_16785 [Alicyclobacillus cycloheptanicus]